MEQYYENALEKSSNGGKRTISIIKTSGTYSNNSKASKNSKGKMSVTKITLQPKINFSDGFTLETDEMEKMQDRAHRYCFIANSLSEEVDVKIL